MNAMYMHVDLYDLVRNNKISLAEFMRRLDEREMECWRRGYDEGFKNAKIMFAPIETLLADGVQ